MNKASGEETKKKKKKRIGKKADTPFPAQSKENQGVGDTEHCTDQREELLFTHCRARLCEAQAPHCWREGEEAHFKKEKTKLQI